MGLTSKNNSLATLKTIAFVQIIPWFAVSFVAVLASMLMFSGLMGRISTSGPRMMVWYPLLSSGITTALSLTKDIGFIVWARRKLYSDFRECAVRVVSPIQWAKPPPLPAAVATLGGG